MRIEVLWYPLIGIAAWIILAYWAAKNTTKENYVFALILITVLSMFWFVLPFYFVIGAAGAGIYKIANHRRESDLEQSSVASQGEA